jgi:hypothetical protein
MAKKTDEQHDADVPASSAAAREEAGAGPPVKMKRKEYERQMRVLHGEIVIFDRSWYNRAGVAPWYIAHR